MNNLPRTYIYLYGGAIGETVYGLDLARGLAARSNGTRLVFISTRHSSFAKQLVELAPLTEYREVIKTRPLSWIFLASLLFNPHAIAVHEPLSAHMPLWWRLILWLAAHTGGSVEVRVVPRQSAHALPKRSHAVFYDVFRGHIFDTIAPVLDAWGLQGGGVRPRFESDVAGTERSRNIPPYLCVHFFGGRRSRTLGLAQGREILEALRRAFPQYELVMTCAPHEKQEALAIAGVQARVMAGLCAKEVIALLSGASGYIGVDTGMTHLACHVGVPSVVLGHYANDAWMPTYATRLVLLRGTEGDSDPYRSLHAITGEKVAQALAQVLSYDEAHV